MIRFFENIRIGVICLCSVYLCTGPAYAYTIVPIYDMGAYQSACEQLKKMQENIEQWSELIGTVQAQIDTVREVSTAITDIKGTISSTVHDLTAQVADEVGLRAIMNPIAQLQDLADAVKGVYGDASDLAKQIQSLPDAAKGNLNSVGLMVSSLKDFISTGLYYDTFQNLGIDGWKQIGAHPWEALKSGAVGRTIRRSEAYLDESQCAKAWLDFTAGRSDAELEILSEVIGVNHTRLIEATWFDAIGIRSKRVEALGQGVNSIQTQAEKTPARSGAATSANVRDAATLNEAAQSMNIKIMASGSQSEAEAKQTRAAAEQDMTNALREINADEDREENENAILEGIE